jgi:hypothetical protein
MELPALSQALRSSVALRDKVLVVLLEPGALAVAEHVEGIAQTLALLRALDLRVIVVHASPAGEGAADATPKLIGAIAQHEQRALCILPHGVVRTLPMLPFPLIDQALLIQLCSLRYIPILMMPVVDEAAAPVDLSAEQVASAVAKFLEALLVVRIHEGESGVHLPDEGEPHAISVRTGNADAMLGELLRKAPVKGREP